LRERCSLDAIAASEARRHCFGASLVFRTTHCNRVGPGGVGQMQE
jgi:hypothetical protein